MQPQSLNHDQIVIASAGTGKTTCMVQTYLDLLDTHILPEQILVLTFTQKAAAELKKRIENKILSLEFAERYSKEYQSQTLKQLTSSFIGNFHQLYLRLIQAYHLYPQPFGLEIMTDIPKTYQIRSSIRNVLHQAFISEDIALINILKHHELEKVFKQLENYFDMDMQNIVLQESNPIELELARNYLDLIKRCQTAYTHYCFTHGLIDFNQMEQVVLKFLVEEPKLSIQFCKLISYILVDEFQDTSPVQITMLEQIKKLASTASQPCYFYLVGDPKQSIYQFRNVESQLIQHFQNSIVAAGGNTRVLDKNYRSTPELLTFINQYTECFFPDQSPSQCAQAPNPDSGVILHHLPMPNAKMLIEETRQLEADYISQIILQLLHDGVTAAEIQILYRSNSGLEILVNTLKKMHLPYQVRGAANLLEQQYILDIKNILDFLARDSTLALVGILRSPFFGVSDDALALLSETGPLQLEHLKKLNHPLFLSELLTDAHLLTRAYDLLTQLKTIAHMLSLTELLQSLRQQLQILPILDHFYQDHEASINYLQFEKLLLQLQSKQTPYQFQIWFKMLNLIFSECPQMACLSDHVVQHQAIGLSTIHAAKGLEFPYVFLYQLNRKTPNHRDLWMLYKNQIGLQTRDADGELIKSELFKSLLDQENEDSQDEEKRILYVALTRAKKRLYLPIVQPDKPGKNSHLALLKQAFNLSELAKPWENTNNIFSYHASTTKMFAPETPVVIGKSYTEKSVSEIETFVSCTQLHHYQYVIGLKHSNQALQSKGVKELSEIEQGILFHECLKDYPQKPLLQSYQESLAKHQWMLATSEQNRIISLLQQYTQSKLYATTQSAEANFTELPFAIYLNGNMIRGQMDQLISHQGTWTIIDYKLSNQKPSHIYAQYLLQMKTYALATLKMLKLTQVRAKIHLIKQELCIDYNFTYDDLMQHEKYLKDILQKMDHPQVPSSIHQTCYTCPFYLQNPICKIPKNI